MALIIIEGMDNTGKTTAAKILAEYLHYNYVSGGGPEVGTYHGALEKMLSGLPNKVQDRTFISEMIYGPIIRGKSGISDQDFMLLIQQFKEEKGVLVYARRPVDRVMATLSDRDQMEGVTENVVELCKKYDYYMLEKLPPYLGAPIIFDFEQTPILPTEGPEKSLFSLIKCRLCDDPEKVCCPPPGPRRRKESASLTEDK